MQLNDFVIFMTLFSLRDFGRALGLVAFRLQFASRKKVGSKELLTTNTSNN
jgi:hypothetical protein